MACWPSSLRRKVQSGWESMKKFSVRTAGAGEVDLGGMVEGGGEGIGPGVATGGVGAPAGGVVPAVAVAAALGQGDVPFLRDKEFGVEAEGAVHSYITCKMQSVDLSSSNHFPMQGIYELDNLLYIK